MLRRHLKLDGRGEQMMARARERGLLSARGQHRARASRGPWPTWTAASASAAIRSHERSCCDQRPASPSAEWHERHLPRVRTTGLAAGEAR